jgi:hypothetical protein
MRLVNGAYICALCGEVVDVPEGTNPQVTLVASGGKPNMRVICADGVTEIHRCPITEPRRPQSAAL